MKLSIQFLLTTTILFGIVACSDDDSNEEQSNFTSQRLQFEILYQNENGVLGAVDDSTFVISNTQDWQQFLDDFNGGTTPPLRSDNFTRTNIDFNSHQMVVAIDSTRPSSGYSITIDSVVERSANIEVYLNRDTSGGPADIVLIPFIIAEIPASSKPVVFEN